LTIKRNDGINWLRGEWIRGRRGRGRSGGMLESREEMRTFIGLGGDGRF